MLCVACSNVAPNPIQIESRGDIFDIWLRKNVEEITSEEDGTKIQYDEAYMQTDEEPEITEVNFEEWFETASEWEPEEEVDYVETEEDFLIELALDHEERICLLELKSEG